MKVRELIEVLKNYNPEELVVYWEEELCDYQDVKSKNINEKLMYRNGPDDYVDEWQMSRDYYKKRNLKAEKVLVI